MGLRVLPCRRRARHIEFFLQHATASTLQQWTPKTGECLRPPKDKHKTSPQTLESKRERKHTVNEEQKKRAQKLFPFNHNPPPHRSSASLKSEKNHPSFQAGKTIKENSSSKNKWVSSHLMPSVEKVSRSRFRHEFFWVPRYAFVVKDTCSSSSSSSVVVLL